MPLVVALAGCSGGGDRAASAVSDTGGIATGDTAVAEVEPPREEFTTPDLRLAEVQGPVKAVALMDSVYGPYMKYGFDEQGRLLKCDDTDFSRAKRDAEGRIVSWDHDTSRTTWTSGGMPATYMIRESDGSIIRHTYTYNDRGWLEQDLTEYEYPDDSGRTVVTYIYGDDAGDAHGNWVRRTVRYDDGTPDSRQERRIIYYECN